MTSKTPIVIDNGTFEIKVGLSSSQKPKIVPTVIGFEYGANEIKKGDYFVGKDCLRKMKAQERPFTQRYPIQRGMFMNWDQMEHMWNYCFKELNVSASDHPILMTANALTPKNHRESLVEMMFEIYNVPQFAVEVPGVLSFFSANKESGLVVESGGGVTHVIPIVDRKPLLDIMGRCPIAGQDISEKLLKLVLTRGYVPDKVEEFKVIQHIKQNMSYVAYDFKDEMVGVKENPKEFTQELELKSGEKIILDAECFICSEILFDPSLAGVRADGLGQVIYDVCSKFEDPIDRKGIYRNIVLGGGNMLIPGMAERIEKELKDLSKQKEEGTAWKKIKPTTCSENSAWVGGAQVCQQGKVNWISKQEYVESGAAIVYKKCF